MVRCFSGRCVEHLPALTSSAKPCRFRSIRRQSRPQRGWHPYLSPLAKPSSCRQAVELRPRTHQRACVFSFVARRGTIRVVLVQPVHAVTEAVTRPTTAVEPPKPNREPKRVCLNPQLTRTLHALTQCTTLTPAFRQDLTERAWVNVF
jgi:hypothetical protein